MFNYNFFLYRPNPNTYKHLIFDKEVKSTTGENTTSSTNSPG